MSGSHHGGTKEQCCDISPVNTGPTKGDPEVLEKTHQKHLHVCKCVFTLIFVLMFIPTGLPHDDVSRTMSYQYLNERHVTLPRFNFQVQQIMFQLQTGH